MEETAVVVSISSERYVREEAGLHKTEYGLRSVCKPLLQRSYPGSAHDLEYDDDCTINMCMRRSGDSSRLSVGNVDG